MGGKVWSEEEERVFWTEIIPTSSKRLLHDRPHAQDAKGWEDLCQVMQETMGGRARRQYTALMLYEHFFQNTVLKRYSPNAAKYARAYQAKDAAAVAAPSLSHRSRAALSRRMRFDAGHPPDLPQDPVAADRSKDSDDPLQLALDAFEILARADRRHQGRGSMPLGSGSASGFGSSSDSGSSSGFDSNFISSSSSGSATTGGFLNTASHRTYDDYPYGSACIDAAQGQLPLPPPRAPQLLFPDIPSTGPPGDSSNSSSSNGTGTPGSVLAVHHVQNHAGSYFGYTPSFYSPADVYGHASPHAVDAIVGQATATAGLPYQPTATPVA